MNRIVLALLVLSCASSEYTEGALAMKWKLPPGVSFENEATEGNVTTAHFSGGVEVRSVKGAPPGIEGADLDALKKTVLESAKLEQKGDVRSGKSGTIPAGQTVRWELTLGDQHTLLYYVPGNGRYLLFSMAAPTRDFNRKSDKIELSLGSLKLQ